MGRTMQCRCRETKPACFCPSARLALISTGCALFPKSRKFLSFTLGISQHLIAQRKGKEFNCPTPSCSFENFRTVKHYAGARAPTDAGNAWPEHDVKKVLTRKTGTKLCVHQIPPAAGTTGRSMYTEPQHSSGFLEVDPDAAALRKAPVKLQKQSSFNYKYSTYLMAKPQSNLQQAPAFPLFLPSLQ